MKTVKFEDAKNKFLGKRGTEKREKYEYELRMDLLGEAIKKARRCTKGSNL